ncbi:iron ABC transporter permease, partial [Streptomyces sp. NRRL F-6602]
MALLVALLVVLSLLSVALGALSIPLGDVVRTLAGRPPDRLTDNVIWSVRVPRTLLGLTTGAALGMAGGLLP